MKCILPVFTIIFFTACSQQKMSMNGKNYFLVRKSSVVSSNIVEIELWKKNGEINYYYTPSLNQSIMLPIRK
jgi:hypothetical protein